LARDAIGIEMSNKSLLQLPIAALRPAQHHDIFTVR
jgi:hypothetical protein